MNIDSAFLTQTLVNLVQINSINPTLSIDGAGEGEIAAYVAEVMQSVGLEATLYQLTDKHYNVVGVRRGSGGGRSLMWNAHMDTVGVAGMPEPFSGAVRDGRLYGRGAQDMKGGLAAMLAAAKALHDSDVQLAGDLILTGVADEEYSSIGTSDIVKTYTADAAIVTEPTDLALCRAHRGFILYDVETIGRAAHGSRYNEGIDAIIHMGRFLALLGELDQDLRVSPPHVLAGPPSLHASIIQGGTEVSTYPAQCHLKLERRTIPGETIAIATNELQTILDHLADDDPTFKATLKPFLSRSPFEISADAPIVRALDAIMAQQMGNPPPHSGATFWTDAAILADAGIPAVLLGPTGAGLHSAEEWIDLQSVASLANILAETATEFCGR